MLFQGLFAPLHGVPIYYGQSLGASDAGKKHLQKKSILTGIVSDGDSSMLKSVKSDRIRSRISKLTVSGQKYLIPCLFSYLPFIDNSDVTVEHVVPLFMVLRDSYPDY